MQQYQSAVSLFSKYAITIKQKLFLVWFMMIVSFGIPEFWINEWYEIGYMVVI